MPGYQPRHDTDPVWFNGTQVNTLNITSAQAGVRITAIHGWDDRPDVRDVRELRSGQDGEYADNVFLGGRTITIEGEVYGSTWANLQSRKRSLAALFMPQSDEVLLKVPDPATASPTTSYSTTGMTGYERASVRVLEAIQFGDTLDPCCQTFQVMLRASDPRVYSDTASSTDSGTTGTSARTVTVDQAGSYETPVTLTVTGPTGSAFSVQEPASDLILAMSGLTLASSESVTFDTKERTAVLGASISRVRLLRSDVIAQWMLNETSGTTADNAQGNATYDGTYTGGFTLNQSGPASGVPSVDLNGSTGYVTVAYNAALNPAIVSFEAWVYCDTLGSQCIVDSYQASNNTGWALNITSAGQLWVFPGDTTGTSILNASAYITVSTWHHVIVTVNTTTDTIRIYLDGVLVGTGIYSGLTPASGDAFQLGRYGTTNYWNGKLSACTLYTGELSGPEVSDLYSAAASTTSLPAYSYLDAEQSRWAHLGTTSSTFTLASSGLNTGSKLNVSYREARV